MHRGMIHRVSTYLLIFLIGGLSVFFYHVNKPTIRQLAGPKKVQLPEIGEITSRIAALEFRVEDVQRIHELEADLEHKNAQIMQLEFTVTQFRIETEDLQNKPSWDIPKPNSNPALQDLLQWAETKHVTPWEPGVGNKLDHQEHLYRFIPDRGMSSSCAICSKTNVPYEYKHHLRKYRFQKKQ